MEICELVKAQRQAFQQENPLPYDVRIQLLKSLKNTILKNEEGILDALKKDLNKSKAEAYMTEIGMVLTEISDAERNLKKWMKPQKKRTSLSQMPAKVRIYREAYGVVLIMSPWNYPFQLTLSPLVGALCGGNRCILKPGNYAKYTAEVIKKIISEAFDPLMVSVVLGGRNENQQLLEQKFDYIFFTGGVNVGKLVLEKAAQHVTPVTLELGGKSPCIVEKSADLEVTAKRIAFGKGLNSGQTCVAPDYLYVQEDIKEEFIQKLKEALNTFYPDALHNDLFPKIINEHHYNRLIALIDGENVVYGGHFEDGKIEPTVLDNITRKSNVMREEIFGPILPILTFTHIQDVIEDINAHDKPLALYLFTKDEQVKHEVLQRVSFGGGCVNDTILHLASSHVPFGGVGASGMGGYHGKYSFDTFTHQKPVVHKFVRPLLSLPFPPFTDKKYKLLKKVLK